MIRKCSYLAWAAVLACFLVSFVFAAPSAWGESLYAGTSNPGLVYQYAGGTSWVAISPDLGWAILCLVEFEGSLYAGVISSSYSGQVYRYEGAGSWSLVADGLDYQVASLAVYNGRLYAGTVGSGARLYRYESDGTWTQVVSYIPSWSGIRSLHAASDGWLYLGDYGWDYIARFDGTSVHDTVYMGGSCIYDFAEYAGRLYAAAYAGRLISTSDGVSWSTVLYHDSYMWEVEPFQGFLYMAHQSGDLRRLDDSWSSQTVWTAPSPIISMIADGDGTLYFGTGGEAGYLGYSGTGQVYAFDGSTAPQPISGVLGAGVQCLLLSQPTVIGPNDLTVYNDIHGCAEGTYTIVAQSPLTADLEFNTVSTSVFGVDGPMALWMKVTQVTTSGGATCQPASDGSVGSVVAAFGYTTPTVSPKYRASFHDIGDRVTFTMQFDGSAFWFTYQEIVVGGILQGLGLPLPSAADWLEAFDDFMTLGPFQRAHDILAEAVGKSWSRQVRAAAEASWELRGLLRNPAEREAFRQILSGLAGQQIPQSKLLKAAAPVFAIYNLLKLIRDVTLVTIQTGGDPLQVSYEAVRR